MVRDTSRESYKELIDTEVLGKRQAEVFAALIEVNNEHGAVTGAELFNLAFPNSTSLALTNIRSRLAELRDMGAVEERVKRRCGFSNKMAITWHITGTRPQKINRISKARRKDLIKEFLTVMLSQARDRKTKEDLKILWRMIKEL